MESCLALRLLYCIIAVLTVAQARPSPTCSLSRLDVLPCQPRRPGIYIPRPGRNYYGVYSTRIRNGPRCILRKRGHIIAKIDDLSTPGLKLIFSPGVDRQPRQMYLNQILVEYNIDCGPGKSAYFTLTKIDVEPQNCPVSSSSRMKCQDYVEVITDNGGVQEFCGSDLSGGNILIGTGRFRMRFRTSDSSRYPGFSGYVVCFANTPPSLNRPGAIAPTGTCSRVRPRDPFAQEFRVQNVNLERYSLESVAEERLDLAPMEGNSFLSKRSVDIRVREIGPSISLTSSEKKVLDTIVSPLFREAFQNARRRTPVWPPPEFNDELDDYEVTSPSLPEILLPIREDKFIPDIPLPQPLPHEFKRSTVSLDTLATRTAVVYQDACNPVLQAATTSFISVASRMNPILLNSVKNQVQLEQRLLPQFN